MKYFILKLIHYIINIIKIRLFIYNIFIYLKLLNYNK